MTAAIQGTAGLPAGRDLCLGAVMASSRKLSFACAILVVAVLATCLAGEFASLHVNCKVHPTHRCKP